MITPKICLIMMAVHSLIENVQLTQDCTLPADIIFVIDGSDSLTEENFQASKDFVVDVIKAFDVRVGGVHIGANVFGTEVGDRIELHGPTQFILLQARIKILYRQPLAVTSTFKAIKEMRNDFSLRGRAGVTKVGVVLTDGKSINVNATSQEALGARNEGINMFAIGFGDNIFRPELNNIAGDPSHVFETANISDVVSIVQMAIKTVTCAVITTPTTTTAAPATTPETGGLGNDFDCPDCLIDANRGFLPHPTVCSKYIEIIPTADGNRTTLVRKCDNGLFWDQYNTVCDRPDKIDCEHDPCKNRAVASYDRDGSCSGFIQCIVGKSFYACCGENARYVAGSGCVSDPTCSDNCQGDDENKLQHPDECNRYTYETDNRYFVEYVEGHGNLTLPCAPGTTFNQNTCLCSDFDQTPLSGSLTDCDPAANFTFDDGFTDSSRDHLYVGTEFVTVQDRKAVFAGDGMMNIYRFSGDTFAQSLVMRLRFQSSGTGATTQALVTNCIYSNETRSSVSLKVVRSQGISVVVFALDTEYGTTEVSVPFNTASMNEVIYIYDGENLTGVVNGVRSQASVTGNVLRRRSGIVIGAGSQLGFFRGTVEQFQLYKCMPALADAYRA